MRSDFTGGSAQPIFDHLQNDDYEPNQHSLRNRIPDRSGRHGVVQRLAAGLGRKQRRRTGPAGSRLHASRNTAGTYPKLWTGFLKSHGITVVHVVSSSKFARKCEEAGVDAIVAEGFEAGGHNGREETTTLCLIPAVRRVTSLPLIAAGGIATGAGMLAAMTLGAEGAQIGTRFAFAAESSAHENFKNRCLSLEEGDTMLMLKKVSPTRLVKGGFFREVEEAENRGATAEELKTLLGKGRAKKGMFEGDLDNGELEIGQVASLFREQQTAAEIVHDIVTEYRNLLNESKEKLSI